VASAFVFRAVVASKAEAWSGELRKWDQFQKRRASVEARLARMQGLLDRRTDGYASLQRLAALLPAEVWLEEWEAEAGDGGRYTHHLTGYSLSEGRVPEFLARLEDGKRYRSVRLKSTERIKGEKVEKETGISANRKDLVRFQVVVAE
jgi:Tfp pilus assembly protein PilN